MWFVKGVRKRERLPRAGRSQPPSAIRIPRLSRTAHRLAAAPFASNNRHSTIAANSEQNHPRCNQSKQRHVQRRAEQSGIPRVFHESKLRLLVNIRNRRPIVNPRYEKLLPLPKVLIELPPERSPPPHPGPHGLLQRKLHHQHRRSEPQPLRQSRLTDPLLGISRHQRLDARLLIQHHAHLRNHEALQRAKSFASISGCSAPRNTGVCAEPPPDLSQRRPARGSITGSKTALLHHKHA